MKAEAEAEAAGYEADESDCFHGFVSMGGAWGRGLFSEEEAQRKPRFIVLKFPLRLERKA